MKNLYFIAITAEKLLAKEVSAFKNYMSAKYFSKAALTSPPHITLYPPFKWGIENENQILDSLELFIQNKESFTINLNGFDSFGSRTIYIKPEISEKLNNLHKGLLLHLKLSINLSDQQNERPYLPHMTIATRDLRKEFFQEAWKEFRRKEFNRDFNVAGITLLRHNGKFWDIAKIFTFVH